jgi:regulator of protease activity HflC (stomatin/prohibitin superfamily)
MDKYRTAPVLIARTLDVSLVVGFIALVMWGFPTYSIWSREQGGKAQLAEAEWSKRIAVEEARAKLESAKLESRAEVERAKGAAEAQAIVSETLSEQYLRYLWITHVEGGENRQVIYVPTEAGLPILEAGKRE